MLVDRAFGRDVDISDPDYVKAQAAFEDLKHRQKLIHYLVRQLIFYSIHIQCKYLSVCFACWWTQGLGVMTNAQYEKVAEIQAGITDIQIRHHFVRERREVHKMKLDARTCTASYGMLVALSVSLCCKSHCSRNWMQTMAERLHAEWDKIMDPIKDAAHKMCVLNSETPRLGG